MWLPNGTLVYVQTARRFATVTTYFDGRYHLRAYQHPEQPVFRAKKRDVFEAYESFRGCRIVDLRWNTRPSYYILANVDFAYDEHRERKAAQQIRTERIRSGEVDRWLRDGTRARRRR